MKRSSFTVSQIMEALKRVEAGLAGPELNRPELVKESVEELREIAIGLLATLKARLAKISNWQATEVNRDSVRLTIHDYLYSDATGLPVDDYDEEEVEMLTDEVYQHIWRAHSTLPSLVYAP